MDSVFDGSVQLLKASAGAAGGAAGLEKQGSAKEKSGEDTEAEGTG